MRLRSMLARFIINQIFFAPVTQQLLRKKE